MAAELLLSSPPAMCIRRVLGCVLTMKTKTTWQVFDQENNSKGRQRSLNEFPQEKRIW